MKVALCISGQSRTYRKAYEYYKNNLIDIFDTDIFIHTWQDKNTDDLVTIYNPKNFKAEIQFSDNFAKRYERDFGENFTSSTLFQFNSLFKCNELKKQCEIENNFIYDAVIRTRFDFGLNFIPDLNSLEKDKIYLPCDWGDRGEQEKFCSDYFAYGSSYVMDRYSSTFINLDYLYNNGVAFNPERLCYANLSMYNLVGKNTKFINFNRLFQSGIRNNRVDACENSFLT